MQRIHTANLNGSSLKDMASCYRLSYSDMVRALKTWRTSHGFSKPVSNKQLDAAAEASVGKGQHFAHAFRMDTRKY